MLTATACRILLPALYLAGKCIACTCSPSAYAPACEKVSGAQVIFVGRVLAAERDENFTAPAAPRVYRFQVETAYKGLPDSARQVMVNPDNFTSCRTRYLIGKRYLVFGGSLPGSKAIFSGECSGSKLFEHAKEDVEFLEAYRLGRSTNSVYGRVLQWAPRFGRPDREEDAPVDGALVVLRTESRQRTQRTTSTGDFRFENLPPGTYTLSARLEPYVPVQSAFTVDVPAVGCIERFPILRAQASISGTVVDHSGKPVRKARVELLRKNQKGEWNETSDFWTSTDDLGQFSFRGLPDGDYLLGYEIRGDEPSVDSAHPTRYFPGVPDRASAAVLRLVPRQVLTGMRFALDKPHTPRRIRVKVVWPDGKAPSENLLQLLDGRRLVTNVGLSFANRKSAPHAGIVEFQGFAERSYSLSVIYWIDNLGSGVPDDEQRIARSEVVRVAPGTQPASVQLVLTRTLLADEDR